MSILLKKRLSTDNSTFINKSIVSYHTILNRPIQHTRPLLLLVLACAMGSVISGCAMPQSDPSQQSIPTDTNQWQEKLGATFEQLSETDRQLLSRYMLRMKLSDAFEAGAVPRISIKKALIQQREYERLHPNNPTGKKSPIIANQQLGRIHAQTYPIALLPIKTSNSDSLNQVKLQFVLSNEGTIPIQSFKGSLLMQDAKLAKGKKFNVPITTFVPPIAPEQSSTIVIETSIEDINVMRAIKNAQDVSITINEGTLMLTDGQKIEFLNKLAE